MTTPFTTISNAGATDLQSLSLLNELQLAYSERRQALGQSAAAPLAAGADLQAASLWSTWQSWIESHVGSWADYTAGTPSPGNYTGLTAIPWLTLAQLRTLAGLPSGGFRRVQGASWPADWTSNTDPAYTFGTCQAGDIIGPWLWVDLQRAFSVLRWAAFYAGWKTAGRGYKKTSIAFNNDYATASAAQISGWPTGWSLGGGSYQIWTEVALNGTEYMVYGERYRQEDDYSCPLDFFVGLDCYLRLTSGGGDFLDLDGLGGGENNLALMASVNGADGTIQIGSPAAANPFPLSGYTDTHLGGGSCFGDLPTHNISRWAFTNQG